MIVWTSTISIFLFRYIFKDFKADLRYIILGSFFPILLDRSLFLMNLNNNPISIGHSLFVTIGLLTIIIELFNRIAFKFESIFGGLIIFSNLTPSKYIFLAIFATALGILASYFSASRSIRTIKNVD